MWCSNISIIIFWIMTHIQIALCHLVKELMRLNGAFCVVLLLLKVQSLTLTQWKIATLVRLEGSKHTRWIKRNYTHLLNDLCFVLMVEVVGRLLSLDDLHERWQYLPHCSCLLPHLCCCVTLLSKLNGCHFSFSPGKWCLQCSGTLQLCH